MGFFSARGHFEDRQIVQWMGESIRLSGQTNFDLGQYSSDKYDSYTDFINGVSASTYVASASTNHTIFQPGIVRIIPPKAVYFSGNTDVITATTQQDVTNFVLTSYDSLGTAVWSPLSAITSTSGSCIPNFYVGTIHPCDPADPVIIQGDLLVRGNTISATTIIETETILVEDNNIEVNYGGDHTTAIGGGITVLSGISNTQDSTIATDTNGVFVLTPGMSASTVDVVNQLNINNLFTGNTVSLLGITSGGTVVNGSSMYSLICDTCSGNFSSTGVTISSGATDVGVNGSEEPVIVDSEPPKDCTEWTLYYYDGRIKQEIVGITNYDVVLKYQSAYNAKVKCTSSNATGNNEGGVSWGTLLPATPTYGTEPTTTGVILDTLSPTQTNEIRIKGGGRISTKNVSELDISNSYLIAVDETTITNIDTSFNTVVTESSQVKISTSSDGFVDTSNRVIMLASDGSNVESATLSGVIASSNSTISVGDAAFGPTGTTIISAKNVVATDSYTTYTDNLIVTDDVTATTFYGNGFLIEDTDSIFYTDLDNAVGGLVLLSGESDTVPRLGVIAAGGADSVTMGVRGSTDVSYPAYGKQGDGFIYSSNGNNGLNIISQPGTGTDDYIRFFAGQASGANGIPDLYIQGSGSTKGYIALGHDTPTERLDVLGSIKMVDGNESNGYVMTSDANGVGSWQAGGAGDNLANTDLTLDGDRLHDLSGNTLTFTGGTTAFMGSVGVKTLTPSFDFEVGGSFGATSKSFVIPHPIKEGKKLVYGAIEGPEFGVYDRGRFFDDTIALPEEWTGLVDESTITVQLTGDGFFMSPYVKEIKDNKVFVGNRFPFIQPTGFYTVYGERKDIDKIKTEIDA